ncbi:EF-hand domain-containing family member B-like [Lycorma delicatula]|uniref:EF-hand domain-containing family member B-like n=1 Tax=Lycorma delicatula TaxID=130591 RepID=UPI003F50D693
MNGTGVVDGSGNFYQDERGRALQGSVLPAGHCNYQKQESVQRCLLNPYADYTNDNLKKSIPTKLYRLPPLRGNQYAGFHTQMRALVQSPPKSMFETLLEEFKETTYDSYWNKRLGRTRDFCQGLPTIIDRENYCFGIKTTSGNNVGMLISPKKSDHQIISESEIGHELYIKSHNDYYPTEQIDRKYTSPPVNKNLVWGIRVPHDKRGIMVKNIMSTAKQVEIGEIEKRFKEKHTSVLGKPFTPDNNINLFPKGYRFGKTTCDKFNFEETMRSCPTSREKINIHEVLEIVNSLRVILLKRSPPFPYRDLIAAFQLRDKSLSGFLDYKTVYDICTLFQIKLSESTFKQICERMKIVNESNLINYNELVEIICPKYSFPKFSKIKDVPDEMLFYKSEYQDNYDSTIKAKGKKSKILKRYALDGKNIYEAMTPSIFTQNGLSYHDYFKVYSKENIKRIFKTIGIEIPEDKFETIWKIAGKKENDGKVYFNRFKEVLMDEMPEISITF